MPKTLIVLTGPTGIGKTGIGIKIAQNFNQAADTSVSYDGKRLADYFANKTECAVIHCDYWRIGAEGNNAANKAFKEKADKKAIEQLLIPYGKRMQEASENYLKHYQKVMFDRTDEGMLSSYYNTATRYAYRYAHPEEDDATGKFYSGSANAKNKTEADYPEQILIVAPNLPENLPGK